ncbi:Protein of unknown function (DUF3467) [Cyclonatronum proteinivorum]|uniref:DUF3467 domain-containing protein n=1 Tax=Cyclonatronum proteinivorum TaxID=1457365 RepID=A0A345ULM4_9BACT|nr:DUF3467 domain-containing protein [Cyclonatronum proteinivorum]AXJ01376.1 Protein of unknown function (DUF3467) [Cyclonatronum proteinivorum]
MQNPNQGKQKKLEIELTKEEAPGTYSNLVMITHSASEFVFDFIAVMPGLPKAKVMKRLVLTPDHAKRLAGALNDNISRFEKQHGTIKTTGKPDVPFNYRGPLPEA